VHIWRAEADVFPGGTANYTVPGIPGGVASFSDYDVSYGTTYYYWLKSCDTSGNLSDESASVNASPSQVLSTDIFDNIQSENYVEGVSGWFIGFRGDYDGYAEFNDVTIRGTLLAGEIHIPDKTTADSFHVSATGDTWWGCDEDDFVSDPDNAAAYILNDGTAKFGFGVSMKGGVFIFDSKLQPGTYNLGLLKIYDDSIMDANVGGAIVFGGMYTSAGDWADGGSINCYKVNDTSGNYSFGLELNTRLNGNAPAVAVRIDENKNLTAIGSIIAAGFKMTTSPTAGYVLTADADGVGSWQASGKDGGHFGATVARTSGAITLSDAEHNITITGVLTAISKTGGGELDDGHVVIIRRASGAGTIAQVNGDDFKLQGGGFNFNHDSDRLVLIARGDGTFDELTRSSPG